MVTQQGIGPTVHSRQQLRFLIVEDTRADAELVAAALKRAGFSFSFEVVSTPKELQEQLKQSEYDLVLSDHNLRSWTGMEALEILHQSGKDIPFILVTASIGDESAVEYIKRGGADYILKDRLARLPVAVEHALREKVQQAERKRLEEQLRVAQKMEAVGRLAGGIAHDFNNLLTVIRGYSEMLTEELPAEAERNRRAAHEIYAAADRAATLTRQLLAFSRRQVLAPKVLDLNEVVTRMDEMLRRLIGEDIQLACLRKPGLGRVKADPGQIEQVIMNLVVNARDAMPQGGKLTVETANVELDETYARGHVAIQPGSYVMLAVSDTGCGMDAELQTHIFEPFFTTKEQGKGTGLGLATVYGIVKQSGGYIWVYSEVGQGSTFKIYLPQVEEEDSRPEAGQPAEAPAQGTETILLVEDEPSVRALLRETLKKTGYAVLEAQDAAHALQIAHQHAEPIHLLLTDVVMPQISGRALAGLLSPLHPETKILYMSGYTDDAIVNHGVLEPGVAFLQKPFTAADLARKVRETMESKT